MDHPSWLFPAALTPSGRPVLLPTETELSLLPSVDLEPPLPSLPAAALLVLTSHRLLLLHPPSAVAIPLSSLVHAFPPKKSIRGIFSSPRIRLQLSGSHVLTLVLRGKPDPDAFFSLLWDALRARAWEAAAPLHPAQPAPPPRAVVGVSGILRKEQEQWESTDKSLQDAFQDLNALMGKAKEMVMLAERMRQKLLSGAGASGGEEEVGTKQEMQDWMLSVGIQSPVTKESAGALYHQQLSRQLADFVKIPLEKAGGMIALIDVYCLFNRARGTELISPEDLLRACALWEKFDVYAQQNLQPFSAVYLINSPVMLRKFDSGVMVIQNKSHSDAKVFASIASLAQKPDALRTGISPSDAALTLGIAPALAKENLLTAESKGLLCRDVSAEGFRFYINLFKEIDPTDIHSIKEGVFQTWASTVSASG